jgi:hypothetical protein
MSATFRSIVERLCSAGEHSGAATVAELIDEIASEFRQRYPAAPPVQRSAPRTHWSAGRSWPCSRPISSRKTPRRRSTCTDGAYSC